MGHEMRGPVRTKRGGISKAGVRQDQVSEKGEGVRGRRLSTKPLFFLIVNLIVIFGFLSL